MDNHREHFDVASFFHLSPKSGKGGFVTSSDNQHGDELEQQNRFLQDTRKAILNILEDITESEQKLKQQTSELEKFRLATDTSFDHLIITDPDGKILYANKAAEKLTGYVFDEMKGKTPALWGKQMDPEFYAEFWKKVKVEKKPYLGEIINKRKNGQTYLASIRVSPILDDRGEVSFFVGVEQDITEERRHQKELALHAEELERANVRIEKEKERAEGILRFLQSIGEGVFATDISGNIIFANKTAAELCGFEPEELLGQPHQNMFCFQIGEEAGQCDIFPIREAMQKGVPQSFHGKTFLKTSAKKIPVSGTFSPIRDQEKEVTGVIVVFQDITEQYNLEQLKDRFLSVAAHQLRTPLGSMRWSMELLMNGDLGKLSKEAKEAVGQLYDNSARMLSLVNDLLSVSRIDQKQGKEEMTDVDVIELVREAAKTLEAEAEKKAIRMNLLVPKRKFSKVHGVEKHLFEAVENLIANAIRYNRPSGTITVKCEKDGEWLQVSVTDTGIGIPKEDQKKIFSKFFRASNAVRAVADGSGLGLSVVKSYAEENGGTIAFESTENVGTTFVLRLPFLKDKS